jgi:hypothetical protein
LAASGSNPASARRINPGRRLPAFFIFHFRPALIAFGFPNTTSRPSFGIPKYNDRAAEKPP